MTRPEDALPEDVLSAYLDGECTPVERAAVDARLATDPEWRAVLDEVAAARDAVRALPRREPPAGFIDELLHPARPARFTRAAAAVAAVAAVVAGFVLASPSRSDEPVAPQLATLSSSHGATVSLEEDPVTSLAPVAVPVEFAP